MLFIFLRYVIGVIYGTLRFAILGTTRSPLNRHDKKRMSRHSK